MEVFNIFNTFIYPHLGSNKGQADGYQIGLLDKLFSLKDKDGNGAFTLIGRIIKELKKDVNIPVEFEHAYKGLKLSLTEQESTFKQFLTSYKDVQRKTTLVKNKLIVKYAKFHGIMNL
jgi:hypothetical protein